MQVFEMSVLAAFAVVFYNPADTKPLDLQLHQNRTKRTLHGNLATSRLYLQGSRASSTSNRTVQDSNNIYHLPSDWQCLSVVQWRDLGEDYYPRFVKQVICTARYCYNDFFTCFPQYYPLPVLRTLHDNEAPHDETALPLQLREAWRFEVIDVSVACMCGE